MAGRKRAPAVESTGWQQTHIPCPQCGSSDGASINDKGWLHCFVCQASIQTEGERPTMDMQESVRSADLISDYEFVDIGSRGLTAEDCRAWSYGVGALKNGRRCHVANYLEDGKIVSQKVRSVDPDTGKKTFAVLGPVKGHDMPLYGMWKWKDGGKQVVITEGEIDAIVVSRIQEHRWPVVSIPNGAQAAVKSITKHAGWLSGFERIILMLDNDDPGRAASKAIASVLPPGRVWLANLDPKYKDPCEAHLANDDLAIKRAIWDAKQYRPDGVVSAGDVRGRAREIPQVTRPWPWDEMTKITLGRRPGELIGFGAGTGVGKTDVFTQVIEHDVFRLGLKVGVIYLEQPAGQTMARVAGKHIRKRLHVPDAGWTPEERDAALDMIPDDHLYFYDHFGSKDWSVVRDVILFMAAGLGCEHIYLDNLTALVADAEDENTALKGIMSDMAGDAERLGIVLHYISHLTTPEGKPHEEGGRVMIRHFRGSRTIGFWSHMMFGLERNSQADDPSEKNRMYVRCLKERFAGGGTGQGFSLFYAQDTGMLMSEADAPERHTSSPKDTESEDGL